MATDAAHAFLLLVPVLWAALRFEVRGAAFSVLGLAVAISFHAQGIDPAQVSSATAALPHVKMQALTLVAASTGLIAAAVIRQQRQAVADLARANAELEARVAERTRAIEVAEMEGHPPDQFTHPDDLSPVEAAWNRLKSGAADEYELEKRYIRKDGSTMCGHTTVSCPAGFRSVARNF